MGNISGKNAAADVETVRQADIILNAWSLGTSSSFRRGCLLCDIFSAQMGAAYISCAYAMLHTSFRLAFCDPSMLA